MVKAALNVINTICLPKLGLPAVQRLNESDICWCSAYISSNKRGGRGRGGMEGGSKVPPYYIA